MNWSATAAVNLAIAVMLGAFGAHGLHFAPNSPADIWWHTATLYFFVHALGLLLIGVLIRITPLSRLYLAARLLQIGIILFCGSLYLMALGAPHWLGFITPLGGLAFITGWLWTAWRLK